MRYYCFGCRESGDLIELLARTLKQSNRSTGQQLYAIGAIESNREANLLAIIDDYERVLHRQNRAARTWDAAKDYVAKYDKPLVLARKLSLLRPQITPNRWQQGPQELFGALRLTAIEKGLHLGHAHTKGENVKRNPDGLWDQTLVFPLYTAPGNIGGFQLVGREGRRWQDFRFISMTGRRVPGPASLKDMGLYGLHNLWDAEEGEDGTIFAVDDVVTAARMQLKHFLTAPKPLPLVAWHASQHGVSSHSWNFAGQRRVVFWASGVSPQLARQAALTNGYVAFCGPTTPSWQAISEYLQDRQPQDLLALFDRQAKPWGEAIASHLENVSADALAEFVHEVSAYGLSMEPLLQKCSKQLLQKINALGMGLAHKVSRRRDLWRVAQVRETVNGWFVQIATDTNEKQITNTVVKVDEVLTNQESAQVFARGRIVQGERSVRFCVPRERLEIRKGWEWLSQTVVKAGMLPLQRMMEDISRASVWTLASLFNEPPVREVGVRVGWSEEQQQFLFPRFRLLANGTVVQELPLLKTIYSPAARIRPGDCDFRRMPNKRSSHVYWAIIATTLANVLAPIFGKKTACIGIVGDEIRELGKLALSVAGSVVLSKRLHSSKLANLEKRHGWPIGVESSRDADFRRWLQAPSDKVNRAVLIPESDAIGLRVRGDWRMIQAKEAKPEPWMMENADHLVADYLQDLCRRELRLEREGHFVKSILRDMAEWVCRRNGKPEAVLNATRVLRLDTRHAAGNNFVAFLAEARMDGMLEVVETGFSKIPKGFNGALVYDTADTRGLFISAASLNRLCRKYDIDRFSYAEVTKALRAAGCLESSGTVRGEDGWVINLDTWNTQVRKTRIQLSGE